MFNKEELFKIIEHALQVLIQFKHKLILLFVIKMLFEMLHFLHWYEFKYFVEQFEHEIIFSKQKYSLHNGHKIEQLLQKNSLQSEHLFKLKGFE